MIFSLKEKLLEPSSMIREGVFVACAALIAAAILIAGYLVTTSCGCDNIAPVGKSAPAVEVRAAPRIIST